HYYPFGMKHSVYVPADKKIFGLNPGEEELKIKVVTKTDYLYEYNGKEFQDELNLNLYDYHARNYDPAIGRWINIDPMAPKYFSHSPYAYALNAPTYFIDPDGMQVLGNGEPDDDCKGCPAVELETVVITPKAPKKSSGSLLIYIPPAIRDYSIGRDIFGYNYEKYSELYKDPNWLAGYKKMYDAKREGELGVAILFSLPYAIVATPAVIAYGSMAIETSYGSFIIKTGIDATAQYAISGDVNWLNAAAGSVLPGKAGYLGSPILSEGADVLQYEKISDFNFQKSSANVVGGYLGSLSGFGTKAVSSDWSSSIGSFIFSNGVQSFHTQGNTEIIKSNSKN
ncbi:MAG: RHS repeat-associated core domain-containing protein, partial [Weeksellaceae bacterium]